MEKHTDLDMPNTLMNIDEEMEFLPFMPIEVQDDSDTNYPPEYPDTLPLIPLRNTVLFIGVTVPIAIGRENSVRAIKHANSRNKFVALLAQKNQDVEQPNQDELYQTGTIARIVRTLRMPDGSMTAILQGKHLFETVEIIPTNEPFYLVKINILPTEPVPNDPEFKALTSAVRDTAINIINNSPHIPDEAATMLRDIDKPEKLLHFVATNLNVDIAEKQFLLEKTDYKQRAFKTLQHLSVELQLLELKNKIQQRARVDIDKQQRDYFLQQQLRSIQEELGDSTDADMDEFSLRAGKKQWPKAAKEAFERELKRLRRMNPAMPDYSMALNYVELLLDLPWQQYTKDDFNLNRAIDILDKDHYGLEKVKTRIIEYLAVLKLKGDMKSPILCFLGPPGVGKTSLGQSVAKALRRKYIRMSLGGLHDEAEIRGHRRTYIGAMPGRILQNINKAKSANPVFILDEVDKMGSDFRGDPSNALLEVLDPEQNFSFYDNYLEVDFDLSKVLFIATANTLEGLHPALRDRMEIIQISGYSLEEKIEIAKRHLVPKQRENHGLVAKQIKLTDVVLATIVQKYTRESGVRELDRQIAAVMRATAKKVALNETYNITIKPTELSSILGKRTYENDIYQDDNPAGVSVGLAWTPTGGDILFIETSLSLGSGNLTLTGNLGEVMKESATTALSFIKANHQIWAIDPDRIAHTNFHLHVPEGAVPKDGPSAGIAMLTALVSALTNKPVKPYLAMTGEITLRGKVLPVGGIKEKILAAKRTGIKTVILCADNKKDVDDIKPNYITGLEIHYVKHIKDVIAAGIDL
ncbi:MAG: endopeptidase La [Bacteroidetes bacterium]|jgi:ATP-dependent Lon protease|nr:endopeptidase La [Bacteroidota bacterium]